ncbi:MAG TPA: histidine kinase dimerization/phospho-acceptor domain-containing protein, partial [Aggregatilineales bacterium]|nr:histidine kinase dimerization/phospho-acceptor domain-containing protein [Aggregatilineales bacterium]
MATGTQDELTRLKIRNAELEAALADANEALDEATIELEQQRLEMDALHQFDREMTRSEDIDFIMEYVGTWAVMRTRSDYGVIARWDTRRQCFEVLQATGIPLENDYRPGDTLELPEELTPQENMDKRSTGVMFNVSHTHMVSELRHADGRLMGVMFLQRHNEFKFTEADKKFLRSIADRLANSMHMAVLLRRVQDLNQHRSQLFRMLSHDLRQPLTVLMGYIQLIQHAFKNGDPKVVEGYINHVANGAQDLKDLLEEVLLMERIADSTRDDWKTISLRKAIEQAIKKHSGQAELSEHNLEIE